MKCTDCNNKEATVFYREVINGKETRYALCPECAKKKEKEQSGLFLEFSDPFKGGSIFESFFAPAKPQARRRDEKRCTLCASTFRELAKAGMVGCPECYIVFSDELAPTVARLHGNAEHRGRVPRGQERQVTMEEQIAALRKELKESILQENYEEAAVLRDKIRALRENGKEG